MISEKGKVKIDELKQDIVKMAHYIQQLYSKSRVALIERNEHNARDVIYSDSIVDAFSTEIEERIVKLLGILTPIGRDLRFLASAMEINSTLEQIADNCVAISESSIELSKKPPIGLYGKLHKMFDEVYNMLSGAVHNLVLPSFTEGKMICEKDDMVDKLLEEAEKELIEILENTPKVITRGVSLLTVFRSLETIADLCTKLIAYATFIDSGKHYRCKDDTLAETDINVQD
ncbi:MAG: phosphate signaling complex PhoU family protein [Petrotogales bacterium]